jgi:hypothetical protein
MKALEPLLAAGFTMMVYRALPTHNNRCLTAFQVLNLVGISTGVGDYFLLLTVTIPINSGRALCTGCGDDCMSAL